MVEHAPAPWSRDEYGHIIDANGQYIIVMPLAISTLGHGTTEETQVAQANTDLFFTAPDLLAACEDALGFMETFTIRADAIRLRSLLKQAIEKAHGRKT